MKKNTGFTIIELLVVIAIIGILSSVVINSVAKSREKAHDGAAKADLSGVRSEATLYFDENNFSYGSAGTACNTAGSVFDPLAQNNINAMAVAAGTVVTGSATCANSTTDYVVSVPLQGGGNWCVDSNGYANTTALDLTGPGSLTEKVACQ